MKKKQHKDGVGSVRRLLRHCQMPDTISAILRDAFEMFPCFQKCYLFTLRLLMETLQCGKRCSYDGLLQVYSTSTCVLEGTEVAQWLRCCATNRKVAGSIPADVTGIFH